MTRREFLIVLHNLYGDAVSANIGDVVAANAKVTSEFVCNRFVALSQALNFKIKWSGYKNKMTRKDVARYIVLFASYNAALAPRK